ncbi:MAG: hypothetical protein KUG83_02775 [Gammaproteobacteria bacterium]|nr:hypothetical protein [Gammaproteobacteria bacterium]
MNEIILCGRNFSPSAFKNECGIEVEQTSSFTCSNPNMIFANRPYLLKNEHPTPGATSLAKLSNLETAKNLTDLSLSFGGDNIVALSGISAKLREYNVGLIGASTSVYAGRMKGFIGAVGSYQSALMEYRQAVTTKSPAKTAAKKNARMAFDNMQRGFKQEVKIATSQIKSNHGTPMTSFKRAADISRSSRSIAKLDLVNQIQAENVVKFTKYTKFLGNGLAVIDFGSRVTNIHNAHRGGANWEREMFIESSSFAASAIAGTLTVNAGLAMLIFLTPFGWMGLVAGGLAVAGSAAGISIGVNNAFESNSGNWYDYIMTLVN